MRKPDTLTMLTRYEQFAIDQRRADKTISPLRIQLAWAALPNDMGEDSPKGNPRNPDYDDTIAAMPGSSHYHRFPCLADHGQRCTCY